jgi:TPR repeat protein
MSINFYNAGMNAFEAGNYKEAYDFLMQDDQEPRCAFALGVLYYNGQGVDRSFKLSTHYYTAAAEAGIIPAQVSAGFAYANAMGAPEDFDKAVKYLQPAAEAGEAAAQVTLAEIYAKGYQGGSIKEAAELIRNVLKYVPTSEEAQDVYSRYQRHLY